MLREYYTTKPQARTVESLLIDGRMMNFDINMLNTKRFHGKEMRTSPEIDR